MDARQTDRVWDIIEKVGVGMLTTQFAAGLRARPLEARPDRGAGIIWFLREVPTPDQGIGRWYRDSEPTSRCRGPKSSSPDRT